MCEEQQGEEQRGWIDPQDAWWWWWCHFQAALRPRCIPVGGVESVSAALRLRRERERESGAEEGRGGDAGKEGPQPAESCQSAGCGARAETPHTRSHCKKSSIRINIRFVIQCYIMSTFVMIECMGDCKEVQNLLSPLLNESRLQRNVPFTKDTQPETRN